jgi:hypothetical protein
MSAPQAPREPNAIRQGPPDGVAMPRAMGSAGHAAAAGPEPPQAGGALAQVVDPSTASEAPLRHLLDTLPNLDVRATGQTASPPSATNAGMPIRGSHRRRLTAGGGKRRSIPKTAGS